MSTIQNKTRMTSVLVILGMLFSLAHTSPARAASFIMTDLGTFSGTRSGATAINEAG